VEHDSGSGLTVPLLDERSAAGSSLAFWVRSPPADLPDTHKTIGQPFELNTAVLRTTAGFWLGCSPCDPKGLVVDRNYLGCKGQVVDNKKNRQKQRKGGSNSDQEYEPVDESENCSAVDHVFGPLLS
jgi:hypothetical protein